MLELTKLTISDGTDVRMVRNILYAATGLPRLLFHSLCVPLWLALGKEDKAEYHNKKIEQLKSE